MAVKDGLFSKYPMLPPIANFGPFLDPPPFSYTLRDSQDTECLDLEVVSMAIDLELHKAGRFSCSCDESSHSRSVVLEHLVEYHSLWIPENVAKIVSAILDDDMDVVATLLPRPTYSFAAACWVSNSDNELELYDELKSASSTALRTSHTGSVLTFPSPTLSSHPVPLRRTSVLAERPTTPIVVDVHNKVAVAQPGAFCLSPPRRRGHVRACQRSRV